MYTGENLISEGELFGCLHGRGSGRQLSWMPSYVVSTTGQVSPSYQVQYPQDNYHINTQNKKWDLLLSLNIQIQFPICIFFWNLFSFLRIISQMDITTYLIKYYQHNICIPSSRVSMTQDGKSGRVVSGKPILCFSLYIFM